jgi:hypothetical protein
MIWSMVEGFSTLNIFFVFTESPYHWPLEIIRNTLLSRFFKYLPGGVLVLCPVNCEHAGWFQEHYYHTSGTVTGK